TSPWFFGVYGSRVTISAAHNLILPVPIIGRGDFHEAHHFAAWTASMAVVEHSIDLSGPLCRPSAARSVRAQCDPRLSGERRPFRALAQRAAHRSFVVGREDI